MKYLAAAILLSLAAFCGGDAFAKDGCTHTWGKGKYRSFKQVQREVQERLSGSKILRFSLCSAGEVHYFLVTVLEASGKVLVMRMPAH